MPRRWRHSLVLPLCRSALFVLVMWLIYLQSDWLEAERRPLMSLRRAGVYFPDATRMEVRDPERNMHVVTDQYDEILGGLFTTLPETDHIIGYSGPNNLLVALDQRGSVVGVELLHSGDTREHVEMVRADTNFFRDFVGWRPSEEAPPEFSGVSGATLTSFAIAESIQERIGGVAPSLRFPEPVTLEEVQGLFTNAVTFVREERRLRVLGPDGGVAGFVVRTSPLADNVAGYRGPTECLLALSPDGATVTAIRIRKSYDTPSYVDQVRDAEAFMRLFPGERVEDLATFEFPKIKPDGLSGATLTAKAIAGGVQRRLMADLEAEGRAPTWKPRPRDWGLAAVVLGSMGMAFSSLRRRRWVRIGWQVLLIGYVGVLNHDLLSLALFGGWAAHGPALRAMPGLALLTAAALVIPWATRRQLYCHHLCPHGAAQELLGKVFRRSWTLPPRLTRVLRWVPGLLLLGGVLSLLVGWDANLPAWEPFDAWSLGAAGGATLVIAIVGLLASLFVPQAYCRFGCPTGALLNFVRSAGPRPDSGAAWGRRDWLAVGFLAAGLSSVAMARSWPRADAGLDQVVVEGEAMGTTWTVKIRDDLANPEAVKKAVAKEFEWAENLTSNWRSNTDLSEFNRSRTTNAMVVPWPVMTLARWAGEIGAETGGAYDITVGPLVRLWGFGPDAHPETAPTDEELAQMRAAVGWSNLELLDGMIRKRHPQLEVDLSSIAKGWAIDKVAHVLEFRGLTNFLVEAGGELRASGVWEIGIEHPMRPWQLSSESIATSGVYRQQSASGGKRRTHLIDPRTGRPVVHSTVSVTVRHAECARADAWATALNVLGVEEGMAVAERLGLAVQFVEESEGGRLTVRESSAWALEP